MGMLMIGKQYLDAERPANKSQVEISEIFSEKWVHQFKPLGVSF